MNSRVFLLLIVIAGIATQSFGQENNFKLKKPTNNCIGIYTGIAGFDNIRPLGYYNATIYLGPLYDALISFKRKKHEFIGGPFYIQSWRSRADVFGSTFSYLYHFSTKRTHLFIECNFRNINYTCNNDGFIAPYNKDIPDGSGGNFSNAKIMLLTVHAALGLEVRLCKFLYAQLAFGYGGYWVDPKPGLQTSGGIRNIDPLNSLNPNNFYSNHYGIDWYFRLGLAWRIYKF